MSIFKSQTPVSASYWSTVSRRVITISKKKWGKTSVKTEKIIRDAVPKPDVLKSIDEYLAKARSITCYDLANRFNIRMSVSRRILREKEMKGELIPYIRESGFVVYTTPSEIEKREGGVPIMISDALEEVASSVNSEPVITEEMELALAAAGAPGAVKPSKLARKRREAGEKKEARKDTRPEVIVEPLDGGPVRAPEPPHATAEKESPPKKEEKPKKAAEKPKKEAAKKEEKPKKETPKKAAAKKEEKPKKAADKKEEKPKKAAEKSKKEAAKKEEKPKKETPKKEAAKKEEKPKKAAEKPKKETAKKEEKASKTTSKKKS